MDNLNDKFSQRLKLAMESQNVNQVELAEKTKLKGKEISQSLINKYLKGKALARQQNLFVLASVLNVDEAWLMGLDVPMSKSNESKIPLLRNYSNSLEDSIKHYYLDDINNYNYDSSKKYFGLLINEDSEFYPLLSSGDIAIIEECNEIENGKIYLIEKDNKLIIRKVYKNNNEYELSTFNTFVPAEKCNDVNVIGKVVQALSENIFK